jgi:hypothetical protein
MERHRGAVIPPEEPPLPSADEYRGAMEANYARIKEAAVTYFREDRIVIDAYNKTKHGALLFVCGSQTTRVPSKSSFPSQLTKRPTNPRTASRPFMQPRKK